MKAARKYLVGVVALAALSWCYLHRKPVLYHLTSFDTAKKMRYHESAHAKDYRGAQESSESQFWLRSRIRWDLWCIAMSADITGPRKKDGLIYFVVDATERSDTRCIYVFSSGGELIEVAFQPMA